MINAGATIAIVERNTLLLTLREDFEVWCMPGGETDPGESLVETARREAREETGLEVEITRLVGVYTRVGWWEHHAFLFAARIVGGALTPDPREVLEACFFPFDALPEHLVTGHHQKIADVISGVTGRFVTETFSSPPAPMVSRKELYAMRDRSGLSRRDFYLQYAPLLQIGETKIELEGAPAQTRSSSSQ
jgi:ADP-ribose pyrophosphatase YjhB (NUDIX family)